MCARTRRNFTISKNLRILDINDIFERERLAIKDDIAVDSPPDSFEYGPQSSGEGSKKDTKPTKGETKTNNLVVETKEELAKVVWPSRQQLLSESAAVILMVSLVATVIYLVDNLFSWGSGKVF